MRLRVGACTLAIASCCLACVSTRLSAQDSAAADVTRSRESNSAATFSTTVKMQNDGGTFVIPVLINNVITLKFVVDSGASDVSIPADVVSTLLRTDTIDKSDFVGTQTYELADGTRVPSVRFRLRSLKVGGILIENVLAGVAPLEGSLLLGQSFLGRFKSWSMDNAAHVLVLDQSLAAALPPTTLRPPDLPPASSPAAALQHREQSSEMGGTVSRALKFVLQAEERWSADTVPDPNWLSSIYAQKVDYYGKQVPRQSVVTEKQAFAAKWPQRIYSIEPGSMIARCDVAACIVTGVVNFTARNAERGSSHGVATFAYTLAPAGDTFLIVGESGRVLQRQVDR